jgi:AcrR family transcriptional regulator
MATAPKQARSIATEQKMLDAAEELLKSGDTRQVTVENVTTLAGAKVSSFYARFGNVAGLFDALRNRYRDAVYETSILKGYEKALQQTDLRSALYYSTKPTLELARREHQAISYFLKNPNPDQELLVKQRKFIVDNTLEILQKHRKEIKKKDLRRASENVSRMAHAMWVHLALMEPSEFIGRKTSLSSVIELTTDMAYAYLTTE